MLSLHLHHALLEERREPAVGRIPPKSIRFQAISAEELQPFFVSFRGSSPHGCSYVFKRSACTCTTHLWNSGENLPRAVFRLSHFVSRNSPQSHFARGIGAILSDFEGVPRTGVCILKYQDRNTRCQPAAGFSSGFEPPLSTEFPDTRICTGMMSRCEIESVRQLRGKYFFQVITTPEIRLKVISPEELKLFCHRSRDGSVRVFAF